MCRKKPPPGMWVVFSSYKKVYNLAYAVRQFQLLQQMLATEKMFFVYAAGKEYAQIAQR